MQNGPFQKQNYAVVGLWLSAQSLVWNMVVELQARRLPGPIRSDCFSTCQYETTWCFCGDLWTVSSHVCQQPRHHLFWSAFISKPNQARSSALKHKGATRRRLKFEKKTLLENPVAVSTLQVLYVYKLSDMFTLWWVWTDSPDGLSHMIAWSHESSCHTR